FLAKTPRELVLAYVKISSELQDLLIAPEIRPIKLFPNTSRLLYVVLKGDPATRFSTVTRDGSSVPIDAPNTYHYPAPGETSRHFDVLRVQNPEPGRWDGKVEGPYQVGLVLQKAPFEFSFA